MGTLFVGLILLLIVGLIIRSMRKDKKNGKGGCGCGCRSCASASLCHGNHKNS